MRYAGEHKSGKTTAPKSELSERGAVDVTPKETNVRTRVHEYGGVRARRIEPVDDVHSRVRTARNQPGTRRPSRHHTRGAYLRREAPSYTGLRRKPRCAGHAEPVCLTPESSWPAGRYRFADGCVAPGGAPWWRCASHGPEGKAKPADVVNEGL